MGDLRYGKVRYLAGPGKAGSAKQTASFKLRIKTLSDLARSSRWPSSVSAFAETRCLYTRNRDRI